MQKAEIGVFGLAVMGENLARNLERNGVRTAVYNIDPEHWVHSFMERFGDRNFVPAYSLSEFVDALVRPRKILLMIRAGSPVDAVISSLLPLLSPGDILIDGGNSNYEDTIRRCAQMEAAGCLYVGMGVSGGEEGALHGPALMPGGSAAAWPQLQPVLQAIAARAEDDTPCCDWIGPDGAGHFVKMVHNGIEYGDMQLISEAYHLMRELLHLSNEEMHQVFARWNRGRLQSYLIGITAEILSHQDADGTPILDHILDTAGQKGTGKWAAHAALDAGIPLTMITESVFVRSLSAGKEDRVAAARLYPAEPVHYTGDRDAFLNHLESALYAAKLISYAQGFSLLSAASQEYHWQLDFGRIAALWRNGCIIRSRFLSDITAAYQENPALPHLLHAPLFREAITTALPAWRQVTANAILSGIPVPAFSSALSYFEAFRTERLPANLLQAQRDYFGAHRYERTDTPRGTYFHTDWTGLGGNTASSVYEG